MSYIPIENNINTCIQLKEIIYPYVVLDRCVNFDLSDLVKFSTCKNRNFLNAILLYTWYALVAAISDLIMCLLFTILPVAGTSGNFKMASKMATNNKNGPLN